MEVPLEILDKLKCASCTAYLSCAPVFLKDNATSLCGRCTNTEETATRNIPYEEIAQLVMFPCKYQQRGCKELISFVECKSHEEMCEYKPFSCPIVPVGTCDWFGIQSELLDHCNQQHSDSVATNPVVLTHDITKPSLQTFILSAFNVLFILHAKVCLTTKTIYHSVRLLGDGSRALWYRYNVDVENDDTKVTKHRSVAPQGRMALEEDTSIATNINTLLGTLGVFRGTKFTVLVSAKCLQCCRTVALVQCDDKGWLCRNCAIEKRPCKYSEQGCTYTDISSKTLKHEWHYCQHRTYCFLCTKVFSNADAHDAHAHEHHTYGTGTTWTDTVSDKWIYRFISGDVEKVVFLYKRDVQLLRILIRTPLPTEQLQMYLCKVEFSHPVTGRAFSRTLDASINDINDWCVGIYDDNLNLYTDNNKINIKVDFIKKVS